MTQQEFSDCLRAALTWMQDVQERLKAIDDTQGPRDALEARLRETEKIHQSVHEGQLRMDQVMVAAENLLQNGDEELRSSTNAKLKELKSLWEDTSTYIVHCHSRIEWVWLHWNEYLRAYEEFQLWLLKQQRRLDADVELQLGLKEKLWQVDQQQVVMSDIQSQVALLERLLDEAAALHNRTQDPSVDPQAQQTMQDDYSDVQDRAKERLTLLQTISDEHQMFKSLAEKFQFWLLSKTKELMELMDRDDTAENKLKALKTLDDTVACEEKTLQHIEGVADTVRVSTSPAGAEVVQEEAEELRLGWQRLRQGLCEAEDGLRCKLDSQSQYLTRCQKLEENIRRLREMLDGMDQELEETQESRSCSETTEEEMVGQWRKYSGVRKTLAGEESQMELLKSQLKDLFRFSEDSHHLSDDVLAVVKEHHSVKCRANRLCSESELELRSFLQDPLLLFSRWSHSVSQVMEDSNNISDFSRTSVLLQRIQCLLKDSVQLQERLSMLQVKRDLLDSVFGPERSDGLQEELSAAVRNRELLHTQLLQRKSRLEGLISRTEDFDEAYRLILSKLVAFRERLQAADVLQPDILAKKRQLDQLVVVQKELEDGEAQLMALETLVSSCQSSRTQYEKLCADWTELLRRVTVKVQEAEDTVSDHERFHGNLLNMEKWMMVMRQKLESFCSTSGGWSVEGRRAEAQRALDEFPETDLQMHQMYVQVQKVLNRTSCDGQVHIQKDMKRLSELWMSLQGLSLNLRRLLEGSTETDSGSAERRIRLEAEHPETVSRLGSAELEVIGSGIGSSDGLRVRRSSRGGDPDAEETSRSRVEVIGSGIGSSDGLRVRRSSGGGDPDAEKTSGSRAEVIGSGIGSSDSLRLRRSAGGSDPDAEKTSGSRAEVIGSGIGSSDSLKLRRSAGGSDSDAEKTSGSRAEVIGSGIGSSDSLKLRRSAGGSDSDAEKTSGSRAEVIGSGIGSSDSLRLRRSAGGSDPDAEKTSGSRAEVIGSGIGSSDSLRLRRSAGGGDPDAEKTSGSRVEVIGSGIGSSDSLRLRRSAGGSDPDAEKTSGSRVEVIGSSIGSSDGLRLRRSAGEGDPDAEKTSGSGAEDGSRGSRGPNWARFKAWLSREKEVLDNLGTNWAELSTKEVRSRQETLQVLESRVPEGQQMFQMLLQETPAEDKALEELRYHWLLYKTNLKEASNNRTRIKTGSKFTTSQRVGSKPVLQKKPGLLQRICRLALLLWLLLLALLLLAFLLPLMDEGSSCSLSNNFARSFNVMLRYNGPPPT